MLKYIKKWLPRLLIMMLVTFIMGEIGVRLIGRTNADGQFFFS